MAIKKIKKQFSDLQTSWMWSFESSVNARRSCLRIPSSIRKRRAPSLMVSVRSSFLWTRQSLEPCLFKEALCKQRFLKLPSGIKDKGSKWPRKDTDISFTCNAGLLLILVTFSLARTIRFSSRFHWKIPSLNRT